MAIAVKGEAIITKDGSFLQSCCGCFLDCIDSTVVVPADRGARTATGIFVTNSLPYLTTNSSGEVTLIPEKPPDPAVTFTAPQQLQTYVGATLIGTGQNFTRQLMTARGQVFFRILDTGRFDNSGSYTCTAVLCPSP